MYDFAKNDIAPNLEKLRARLCKMTDAQLFRFGKAAASLCDPTQNFGKPARKTFIVQLKECRIAWRRRNPIG